VVHSRNDKAVSVEHAEHAAANIAGTELELVDTWGHIIWLGPESKVVISRVAAFLGDRCP
jgi:pimeloyl-ACP methyl ester carboxylesterase